ncbi:MAG: DUF11 domain-containing protein, partial [Candidatus Sumerlaeota bacterium]|nr:DUF11 domain-containing protein [Candidatus Sumerlaeota bacterium]
GPDAFGYLAKDSLAPGGPAYQFIDISQTGTPVVFTPDKSSASPPPDGIGGPISLPPGKSFPFYGAAYSQFAMAADGYLSTDPADDGSDNTPDCGLPVAPDKPAGTTGARIYALHGATLALGVGRGYYQHFDAAPRPSDTGQPMGCAVFQWHEARLGLILPLAPENLRGGFFDFEAILYDNGDIVFQYDLRLAQPRVDAAGESGPEPQPLPGVGTIGIQDPSPPTSGLQYSCAAPLSLLPGMAIRFYPAQREVQALKTDALVVDNNGDSQANPGDLLEYTVTITNTGDLPTSPVAFTDTPGANTRLVVGTVTTSAGTIVSGNGAGDTSVEVELDDIPGACEAVVVTFQVEILAPLPADAFEVSNQGLVSGPFLADTPTDDPDTPASPDPTVTPVVASPAVAAMKFVSIFTDLDHDGAADPNDVLRYTILITNSGDRNASGVLFLDTPDPHTQLVYNQVRCSLGGVIRGGAGQVVVFFATIPGGGGTAWVTFRVRVDNVLPWDVVAIVNQGRVAGGNFNDVLTDDPSLPGQADATPIRADPTPLQLGVNPAELDFGDKDIDEGAAGPLAVTLSNDGATTLTVGAVI